MYTKMLLVNTVKPSTKRIVEEEFIRDAMNYFELGIIDRFTYVKRLSRKFLPKKQ